MIPGKEEESTSTDRSSNNAANTSSKENVSPTPKKPLYRSIFCVLTWDTILIYDTHHSQPLAMIRGLHYSNLVDATWSADGHTLIVCSTDGYISFVQFAPGELGQVYKPPTATEVNETRTTTVSAPPPPRLPPCEKGSIAILEARPKKKAKTSAGANTTSSSATNSTVVSSAKRSADDATVAVKQLSLTEEEKSTTSPINVLQPKKKMKRIQPVVALNQ